MASEAARTVTLTDEQVAFIDGLVERGDYGSADEVLRAGVEALRDQDPLLEPWMLAEIVSALDEIERDPSSVMPAEEVFAEIRALHESRHKAHG